MATKAYEQDRPDQVLRFGPFVFFWIQGVLLEEGQVLPIGDRALKILMLLLQRAGQVVSKEELIGHAWPNRVVAVIN